MGDKDNNKLFGNSEFLIGGSLSDLKPLPIVENSIELAFQCEKRWNPNPYRLSRCLLRLKRLLAMM